MAEGLSGVARLAGPIEVISTAASPNRERTQHSSLAIRHSATEVVDDPVGEVRACGASFRPVAAELPSDVISDVKLAARAARGGLLALRKSFLESAIYQPRRLIPA